MLTTTTKFTGPTAQGTRFHMEGGAEEMTFLALLNELDQGGSAREAWDETIVPMVRSGEILVTVWGVEINPLTVW